MHTHRFVHAMLTIDAVRGALHQAGGLPELDELMRATARALECCEQSVRLGQSPRSVPKLRPLQEQLAKTLTANPQRAGGVETAGTLVDACDRVTNSLDTLVSELRRLLGSAPALMSQE